MYEKVYVSFAKKFDNKRSLAWSKERVEIRLILGRMCMIKFRELMIVL